jgi:apolipoprotein N-acyltransferase
MSRAPAMKTLLHRWLFPLATGFILAGAYPPFHLGQNAWFALVPLFFAVEQASPLESFRRGYLAGLAFFGSTVWWTVHVTVAGMVGLIGFLALYFGAAAWWFTMLRKLLRCDEKEDAALPNLLLMFLAATGWVTLEWIRGQVPLGGFGWNNLGVSQWQMLPLIQFSSYTGVYGVSAMLFLVNAAIYLTVRRFWRQIGKAAPVRRLSWEFYIAMTVVCLSLVTGIRKIRELQAAEPSRTLRLALVQANIPQDLKFDPGEKERILTRYSSLTDLATMKPVDLVIWPETATPESLRYDVESYSMATNFAARARYGLLTGTFDLLHINGRLEAFNASMLVRPGGRIADTYHKIHLVPFGEYVPLRKIFPFMKWLTPIQDSFERGQEFTVFEAQSNRFATVICFEDTIPELYRHFVDRGVDFMVNLTNDAWFKNSPAAEMHLANAVFRTVETRRPLVRCTNNGVTCIVDEAGFIHSQMESFVNGFETPELVLRANRPTTFYTTHGNVFVQICILTTGICAALAWRKRIFTVNSAS